MITFGGKNALSTLSNSYMLSLVYRMLVLDDRKMKDVTYISRLKKEPHGAQMRFYKKKLETVSNFSL